VQQRVLAELGEQVAAHGAAVVLDRRGPAVLLTGDIDEPRLAGFAEGVVLRAPVPRIGRLADGLTDQLAQGVLGLGRRQVARVRF